MFEPHIKEQTIFLDDNLCCDNYLRDLPTKYSAFSHFHSDHLHNISSALQQSEVYTSNLTKELIIAIKSKRSGLSKKSNFIGVPFDRDVNLEIGRLRLIDAGHILGAAQILLTNTEGKRILYTGDFELENNKHRIQRCDVLIIDATHGAPGDIRGYLSDEVIEDVMNNIKNDLNKGRNIYFKGNAVQTEYWMYLIRNKLKIENVFLIDERMEAIINVIERYGYHIGPRENFYLKPEVSQPFFRFCYITDKIEPKQNSSIYLISWLGKDDKYPLKKINNTYLIGLSDHADHTETIEYITKCGAQKIITDASRNNGKAIELAIMIQKELCIECKAMK